MKIYLDKIDTQCSPVLHFCCWKMFLFYPRLKMKRGSFFMSISEKHERIEYCPFCGSKIEVYENQEEIC